MPAIRITRISEGIYGFDCHGFVWAYVLIGDDHVALIDTGFANDAAALLESLGSLDNQPSQVRTIIATHAHGDHIGALAELLEATGAESIAHRLDAPYIRREAEVPPAVLTRFEKSIFEQATANVPEAPAARVDHEVEDGDELEVGRWVRVVHAPGHTPGSIALHLPDERLIITGDAAANVGGTPVPGFFNVDRDQAIASFRRLAEVDFTTACFGHGPPLIGGAAAAFKGAASHADDAG